MAKGLLLEGRTKPPEIILVGKGNLELVIWFESHMKMVPEKSPNKHNGLCIFGKMLLLSAPHYCHGPDSDARDVKVYNSLMLVKDSSPLSALHDQQRSTHSPNR
ncbi:unnamed protein product [Sphenostylis stenocarpa]|uniref:Uncharacterized protein n=1 Tax=Sphenostylis stenocarpa TaxID=92480 RepID=A0AA86RZZ8_9FABA|nr:unnamed protein product [Sphenostylis stenocarpa]